MPRRAPSPCKGTRCPKLVDSKVGYCEEHLREHEQKVSDYQKEYKKKNKNNGRNTAYYKKRSSDATENDLNKFYGRSNWKKLRSAYIAKSPLCEHCMLLDRVTPASMVDHIVERRDGGSDYDMDNLQSLCHRCHARKTKAERDKR